MLDGFAQKSFLINYCGCAPPDVRQGYALPSRGRVEWAMPPVRPLAQKLWAKPEPWA